MSGDIPMSLTCLLAIVVLAFLIAFYSYTSGGDGGGGGGGVEQFTGGVAGYTRCARVPVRGIIREILSDNAIRRSEAAAQDQWEMFYPCTYTHAESELRELQLTNKKIYAVDGCDKLASKNMIWRLLVAALGREQSATLMPETFVANDPADLRAFLTSYSPSNMYICKKNVQRKKGLEMSNNLDTLLKCQNRGFKVIQRYFKDVFVLGGRKLNLRMYVAVVCDPDGRRMAYLHRNGKCLYTNRPYSRDSTDFEEQITSVNLDPAVYETLPLDFIELRRTLAADHGIAFVEEIFAPTARKLRQVMGALLPSVCTNGSLRTNVRFQLFGVDVILTDAREPYVLEFNKGPEMHPANTTDYSLKRCVLEDMLRIAQVLPPTAVERTNGFELLTEIRT